MAACSVRAVLVGLVVLGGAAPAAAQPIGAPSDEVRARAVREYDAGRQEFRAERWDDAEARLQRAIDLNPLFVEAHYLLGRTFMELQRYRSAVQAYLAAERAAVRAHEAQRRRAARPLEDASDLEAANGIRRSRYAFPAALPFALGSAYHRLGELADAEREYLTAVQIDPKLGEAHNNLAVLYAALGRTREARDSAQRAERCGFHLHPALREQLGLR